MNFCRNMTTNERFARKQLESSLKESSTYQRLDDEIDGEPTESFLKHESDLSVFNFDRGNCFKNCFSMCTYKPPTQQDILKELNADD